MRIGLTAPLPSPATTVALAIFIAPIPGMAAIVSSAFEKAGISFSLNRRLMCAGGVGGGSH